MNKENLDEFDDYLAEFEEHVFFDNEECPTCGLKFDESESTDNSVIAKFELAKNVNEAYSKLADKEIPAWINNIDGYYYLHIDSVNISKAKKILSDLL